MPRHIKAVAGDCISSIAFREGFFADTLWNLPENAHLKKHTDFSTVLTDGAVVHVPDLRSKSIDVTTGARHRFKRHGVPDKLRIRFLNELGDPRSGLPYEIRTSTGGRAGTTDGDGMLIEFIGPEETHATITLRTDAGPEEYSLQIGSLRPLSADSGAQQRLTQLGYWPGTPDSSDEAEKMRRAIAAFQAAEHLPLTGELDSATLERLKAAFGC